MNTGLLHSLLDAQPSTSAGEPPLKVVMIDRKNIIVNPDNRKIYVIGDVSRLKEDIRVHGIRQPLEVVDLENGDYKLIGGERRLTACEELAKEGDTRFNALPCVILRLKQDDDDKIALITANATARELTDGERLAQYEALKEILTRRKKNGQLEGKVRDELCRILGLSAGAAARLNAISENCDPSTIHQMRIGNITLTGAYKRAQERIAAKQQPAEPPKPEKMVYEKPVVFDCPPKAAETIPESSVEDDEFELDQKMEKAGKLPEWAYSQAAEICREDWTKYLSEFSGEGIRKSKIMEYTHTGHPLQCGGYVHYTSSTVCIGVNTRRIELPWEKFADACKEVGIAPALKPVESEVSRQTEEQQRGKKTLKKLAEKMIDEDAPWELAWEDVQFGLEYYKQSLPGGAMFWKRIDQNRQHAGIMNYDDYAIILQDGKFFTCGWIPKISVIAELVRYFVLK